MEKSITEKLITPDAGDVIEVPVSTDANTIEWDTLELFKRRFNILWENYKDLNIKHITGQFRRAESGGYEGGVDLPCNFRLKGLYVDFRHFYLNDEVTNLGRVANYLAKICVNDKYREFIKNEKKGIKSGLIESGYFEFDSKKITTKELLDIWFNAEIFHNDAAKASKLIEWLDVFKEDTAESLLYMAVYDHILVIKNINWSMLLFSKANLFLRMPNNKQKPNK